MTSELKVKDKSSLTKDINNFKEALNKNNHRLRNNAFIEYDYFRW